jgi:hypothetical protein
MSHIESVPVYVGSHFIHKPFKKQDLATKLREVLDNAKNTAQQ